MTKFLKYSLIAIVIIFIILLIVPHLISLNAYKEEIRVQAKKATGRDLIIDGKISFSILPKPSIELQDVKFSAPVGATKPYTFETKKASAAISLSSLLFRKIEISYIDLKNPEINLEVLKDGSKSWEFSSPKPQVNNQQESASEEGTKDASLPFSIGYINIDGGTLNYIDQSNMTTIENISALTYLGDLSGPLSLKSNFETFGEKIQFNAELTNLHNDSPLNAEIQAFGQVIHIKGDVNIGKSSFNGKLESAGNLKRFVDDKDKTLPTELYKNYTLKTLITAYDQNVEFKDLAIDMGTLSIIGKGGYQLGNDIANLSLELANGESNLNLVIENAKAQNNGKIQLNSKSVKPFLIAIGADITGMPSLISQPISLQSNVSSKDNHYSFNNIVLSSENASLTGSASFAKENSKTLLNFDLKTNNASALARAANVGLPIHLSNLSVKGKTTINDHGLETNTSITTANAVFTASGIVNNSKPEDTNLTLNLNGDNLAQTFRQLEIAPPFAIGKFSLAATATGDFSEKLNVNLNKVALDLNGSNLSFTGKSTINLKDSKPAINLDLAIDKLNLDYLLATTSKTTAGSTVASTSKPATSGKWSKEKIDLSGLKGVNGDFHISIRNLVKGSLVFDNFTINANLSNGELNINSLKSGLYGGNLQGSGSVSSNKDQPISFKATLTNADLKNIPNNSNQFKITKGKFNLNTAINTVGHSEFEFVNALSGNMDFDAQDGTITGFDLQKVINGLKQIKNLNSVLQILENSFAGGETSFKTLKSKIMIDHGNANIKEFIVETDGAKAVAEGNVNLPAYNMDVATTVTTEIKNIPPFKAKFYGPLDNPSHKLDTKVLQDFLVKNVLGNVMDNLSKGKTNPKDLLNGLLGGGNSTQEKSDANNNPQPSKTKPMEELITKGLGNLFKK